MPRSGATWRRSSSAGRWRWCAVPQGISGQCFFQKHAWQGLNRSIRRCAIPRIPSEALLAIDDLDGLIGLVQAAVLEIHPWGASLPTLDQPDMIIMDLDPGEAVSWPEVIAAAGEVRERLAAVGHAQLRQDLGRQGAACRGAAEAEGRLAGGESLHQEHRRRHGGRQPRTLRCHRSPSRSGAARSWSTICATGAARRPWRPIRPGPGPGAPVSMPLAWDELGPGLGPAYFTVDNTPTRLAHLTADPWAGFRSSAVPLPAAKSRRKRAA